MCAGLPPPPRSRTPPSEGFPPPPSSTASFPDDDVKAVLADRVECVGGCDTQQPGPTRAAPSRAGSGGARGPGIGGSPGPVGTRGARPPSACKGGAHVRRGEIGISLSRQVPVWHLQTGRSSLAAAPPNQTAGGTRAPRAPGGQGAGGRGRGARLGPPPLNRGLAPAAPAAPRRPRRPRRPRARAPGARARLGERGLTSSRPPQGQDLPAGALNPPPHPHPRPQVRPRRTDPPLSGLPPPEGAPEGRPEDRRRGGPPASKAP